MHYYCLLCKYSLSLVKYYQECAEIRKLEGREWFLGARKLREFCFLLILMRYVNILIVWQNQSRKHCLCWNDKNEHSNGHPFLIKNSLNHKFIEKSFEWAKHLKIIGNLENLGCVNWILMLKSYWTCI